MSVATLEWAAEQPVRGPAKAVLLVLALHAGADGRCWPSVARVARQCGFCERAVQMALRRLEAVGAIEATRRDRAAPVYRLLVRPIDTGPMPTEQRRLPLFSAIAGGGRRTG